MQRIKEYVFDQDETRLTIQASGEIVGATSLGDRVHVLILVDDAFPAGHQRELLLSVTDFEVSAQWEYRNSCLYKGQMVHLWEIRDGEAA